jgi:hypothetical protein
LPTHEVYQTNLTNSAPYSHVSVLDAAVQVAAPAVLEVERVEIIEEREHGRTRIA